MIWPCGNDEYILGQAACWGYMKYSFIIVATMLHRMLIPAHAISHPSMQHFFKEKFTPMRQIFRVSMPKGLA